MTKALFLATNTIIVKLEKYCYKKNVGLATLLLEK